MIKTKYTWKSHTPLDRCTAHRSALANLIITPKFDRGLSVVRRAELHWLDVPERIKYKLGVMTHRCLNGKAPQYLADYCTPVSDVAARQHLRSASHHLVVPRFRLSTCGRRAYSVAGPATWNSLPDELRNPNNSTDSFKRSLKTFLFSEY